MAHEGLDIKYLDVLRVVNKFRNIGGATCQDILTQASENPGLEIPCDIGEIANICAFLKQKKRLLTQGLKEKNGKTAFFLTNDALILIGAIKPPLPENENHQPKYRDEKPTMTESNKEPPVIVETDSPTTNSHINSKDIAKRQIRDYLRVVSYAQKNSGATAEDVLQFVKTHEGFNIPHDLDKICSRLSDFKQKRGFLLEGPKKNNRKSVILSPMGQDFLNGIEPPKIEKKETIMEKKTKAVPTKNNLDDIFEGIKSAIMNNATKVPEKAKKLGALDRLIASKVICAELREDLVCVRSFIDSLEEA